MPAIQQMCMTGLPKTENRIPLLGERVVDTICTASYCGYSSSPTSYRMYLFGPHRDSYANIWHCYLVCAQVHTVTILIVNERGISGREYRLIIYKLHTEDVHIQLIANNKRYGDSDWDIPQSLISVISMKLL